MKSILLHLGQPQHRYPQPNIVTWRDPFDGANVGALVVDGVMIYMVSGHASLDDAREFMRRYRNREMMIDWSIWAGKVLQ